MRNQFSIYNMLFKIIDYFRHHKVILYFIIWKENHKKLESYRYFPSIIFPIIIIFHKDIYDLQLNKY
jgi:hypothetical protein